MVDWKRAARFVYVFALLNISYPCLLFSNWIRKREDKIVAKGKGELVTYWLEIKPNSKVCQSSRSSESGPGIETTSAPRQKSMTSVSEKTKRLVDWNSDVLRRLLQEILISRDGSTARTTDRDVRDFGEAGVSSDRIGTKNPFDEVKEIIALPPLNKFKNTLSKADVQVPEMVVEQLQNYVSHIAAMYNDNHFHNFEHVCKLSCTALNRLAYFEPGSWFDLSLSWFSPSFILSSTTITRIVI
jgi:hypothetical protein